MSLWLRDTRTTLKPGHSALRVVLKTLLVAFLVVVAVPSFIFFAYHAVPNELLLKQFRSNFNHVETPCGSKKIAQRSFVSNYLNNGNQCDLMVAALFNSEQDFESVADFYSKITVISPGRDKYVSIKTGHYINGKLVFPHHRDYEFAVGDVLENSLPQGKCARDKLCYVIFAIDMSLYHNELRCQ